MQFNFPIGVDPRRSILIVYDAQLHYSALSESMAFALFTLVPGHGGWSFGERCRRARAPNLELDSKTVTRRTKLISTARNLFAFCVEHSTLRESFHCANQCDPVPLRAEAFHITRFEFIACHMSLAVERSRPLIGTRLR